MDLTAFSTSWSVGYLGSRGATQGCESSGSSSPGVCWQNVYDKYRKDQRLIGSQSGTWGIQPGKNVGIKSSPLRRKKIPASGTKAHQPLCHCGIPHWQRTLNRPQIRGTGITASQSGHPGPLWQQRRNRFPESKSCTKSSALDKLVNTHQDQVTDEQVCTDGLYWWPGLFWWPGLC